jgi:hypothetical protein
MIDSWKARAFDCDEEKWTIVRYERTESTESPAGCASSIKQTGLYFHTNSAVRLLSFTRTALPSTADIRAMSDEALCGFLRRATPVR